MNLTANLLNPTLLWLAHGTYALLLLWVVLSAPWRWLHRTPQMLHVYAGACVVLMLLWSMKAGITPGLNFHLLGATLLVLMFGWQLALLALSIVLAAVTLNGLGDWMGFSLNALVMAVLPVGVSNLIYRLVVRYLPHQFFVYIIVNAYFCAGLAMTVTLAGASFLLACCGPYALQQLLREYLPFAPFMIFAEAFFTGMLAAALVLMKPEWIRSFDDRRYLAGK